jgi:pyridoxal phosphate enzyme (YggS family)
MNNLLLENIKNIYRKISSAAIRSGRNPFDVKLVAATKTVDVLKIQEAIELGLRVFGENRVQEGRDKIQTLRAAMPDYAVEWHLIGHLQKNKAKTAVELFGLIHSVDSVGLAVEINRHAEKLGKIQKILIQVKLSEEESKYGIPEGSLTELLREVSKLKHLKVDGLMTMPPFLDNPDMVRPFFRKLSQLRDSAGAEGFILPELSMGMSHDFETAILEGATIVRVGTGIFGERAKQVDNALM